MLKNHYLPLERDPESIIEPSKLRAIKGFRAKQLFKGEENEIQAKGALDNLFTQVSIQGVSKINQTIGNTWLCKIPPIKDWIRMLAIICLGNDSQDNINYVVEKYKLEEQYKWDNRTKPNVENLGRINQFYEFDIDIYVDDDDDY